MDDPFSNEELKELEKDAGPIVMRLCISVRTLASRLLLTRIREIGEKYLGNASSPHLDVALWRAIVEAPERVTDEEINELEALSEQAGGWWTSLHSEPEFLDIGTWTKVYSKATGNTL